MADPAPGTPPARAPARRRGHLGCDPWRPGGSATPRRPSRRSSRSPSGCSPRTATPPRRWTPSSRGRRRHQGRALPPLQRQAGDLRGGLRAGAVPGDDGDRRRRRGAPGPLGQGAGRHAGLPRGGPGAGLPPGRRLRRPLGARPRALPRAGGALDVRPRRRDRPLGAHRRGTRPRRRDARHLHPHLLRRHVGRGRLGRVSDDPAAAALRVEAAIGFILAGLQRLLDEGAGALAPGTTSRR